MTDPATDYARAASDLDGHVHDCPRCIAGHGCADGDEAAEREYRTWRALNSAGSSASRRRSAW